MADKSSASGPTPVRRTRVEIDRIDTKILNALQRDNQVTNLKLAEMVGISAPTCQRRVQRLRDEKVILADVSIIDSTRLGDHLTVIVLVTLREEVNRTMAQMEKRFRAIDEISQCYLVTGEADYVLMVTVRNMGEYEQFMEQVLYADPSIQRFTTLTVIRSVKFQVNAPLSIS